MTHLQLHHGLRPLLAAISLCFVCSLSADIRRFDKATIEKLGVAMFEQDVRAATATDLLFEKQIDPSKEGLRGWIVEGDAKSMLIRFVRERDGALEAFYDVSFEGRKKPVIAEPKNRKLSADQLAQFKGRSLALKHIARPASRSYNTVVLPDPDGDGFLVYALAATNEPNAVMVGGHYRFTVSKDGERLEQSDELFKSFMVLSTKPPDLPAGSTLAALTMTTLVSDLPLETHVYLSLLHKMPFAVVAANGSMWNVEAGKVQAVKK
jgi:hypothetical protein